MVLYLLPQSVRWKYFSEVDWLGVVNVTCLLLYRKKRNMGNEVIIQVDNVHFKKYLSAAFMKSVFQNMHLHYTDR